MSDNLTEMTSESWLSRLTGSLFGILVGLAMIAGGAFLVYWNEGRTVRTAAGLQEGAGAVISVAADRVDPSNEGRLVRFSGEAGTTETLSDADFGVSASAIKLRRRVEMYQWEERRSSHTEKKLGGGTQTITTYTYDKKWSDAPIPSSGFKESAQHSNPPELRFRQNQLVAQKVTVGAYTLSQGLVGQMGDYQRIPVTPRLQGATAKPADGALYFGNNPALPEVGDARVTFEAVRPGQVTVVARQVGSSVEPYTTRAGTRIETLLTGEHSASEIFKTQEESNATLAWILRGAGFLLLLIGFSLVLRPVSVLADVVPFFGSLVEIGTGFIAFSMGLIAFTVVFVLSWIRFRPLLAVGIAAAALAALFVVRKATAKSS